MPQATASHQKPRQIKTAYLSRGRPPQDQTSFYPLCTNGYDPGGNIEEKDPEKLTVVSGGTGTRVEEWHGKYAIIKYQWDQ